MLLALTTLLAGVSAAAAQRPSDTTICDYYTPLITGKENSAVSQYEAMLKITHTFILGNYTTPNVGVAVAGIAAPGDVDGHQVNLLPYFTGGYASTNDGGSMGVSKNFLDDGGAVSLLEGRPAEGKTSNQYALLTHVYQYFGIFFGCSFQGQSDGFPLYQGRASQYEVHRFMDLNAYELTYFNQQVMLAVQSLGFEQADVQFTLDSLDTVFSHRCSPAVTLIPAQAGPQLQSVCLSANCPLDMNATCEAYPDAGYAPFPSVANATLVGNITKEDDGEPSTSSTSSMVTSSASATDGAPGASSTGGAADSLRAQNLALLWGTIIVILGARAFAGTS